jgi:hypothetical protein
MLCKLQGVGLYFHWLYDVCCLFPDCPLRMVPRLRGVGVDSPVLNCAVMGYGGGTCAESGCIFSNSYCTRRYVCGGCTVPKFSDCRNANFLVVISHLRPKHVA